MYSENSKTPSLYKVISYSTPKLHEGKKWYVDFFQVDPTTQQPRRKKYHVDSAGGVKAKRKRAQELIASLNERLRNGWNVWANIEVSREYTPIGEAFEQYEKYTQRTVKTSVMKRKSGYSYLCFSGVFHEWLKNRATPLEYCYQLDITVFSDFLDYVLVERESSARTRNNYRGWLSTFCAWMKEKGYMHDNPIEQISNLKECEKKRDALSEAQLHSLSTHLKEENPHFLLACCMEYYTFIRPGELSAIKLENINIQQQKVFVSSSISKNRRDGMVALNDNIIKMMIDLKVFDHPSEYYLFGKNFRPSEKKSDSRIFRDYFKVVRKKLKWSDSLQFYSLKDSGIRDLANAEGIVAARDQARHTDVTTTNKYLKGDGLIVNEKTKHFKGLL